MPEAFKQFVARHAGKYFVWAEGLKHTDFIGYYKNPDVWKIFLK